MNYARQILLEKLETLQDNRENFKMARERLSKIPETSVISEFLSNYDKDISEINDKIESIMSFLSSRDDEIHPISCRDDLLDLTFVEIASFGSKRHTDYYISTFKSLFSDAPEPKIVVDKEETGAMMQKYNYIYRILIPAGFFNSYSEELTDFIKKMHDLTHAISDPEDGDGS
jgi:hypothetical protein